MRTHKWEHDLKQTHKKNDCEANFTSKPTKNFNSGFLKVILIMTPVLKS